MPHLPDFPKQCLTKIVKNEKPEIENIERVLEGLTRQQKKVKLSGDLKEIYTKAWEILSDEKPEPESKKHLVI